MSGWKLKIFGVTVAEIVSDESEMVLRIDNTGGSFEIAEEPYSPEDDEDYEEEYKFGFGVHKSGPPGAATPFARVRRG